jgi:Predicted transcription factor, homolog of eukaryotic MBF1
MTQPRRPNPVFSDEYQLLRETLSDARRQAGVTQRDLAERLGKSPSHVARIECGQRRVDTLEFYLIARSIGIEPVELFECMTRKLDGLAAAARA